ncbi:MAG: hypothetical protein ABI551_19335 [Polyangiaceae bacterium]
MDALRKDDIERAKATPPGEKARQALELMAMGIAMQRNKLRALDPHASDEDIEERLYAWLAEAR